MAFSGAPCPASPAPAAAPSPAAAPVPTATPATAASAPTAAPASTAAPGSCRVLPKQKNIYIVFTIHLHLLQVKLYLKEVSERLPDYGKTPAGGIVAPRIGNCKG